MKSKRIIKIRGSNLQHNSKTLTGNNEKVPIDIILKIGVTRKFYMEILPLAV